MRTPVAFLLLTFSLPLLPSPARAEATMAAGPSEAAGKNMLWNGTFDGDGLRPWSVGFDSSKNGRAAVTNHELCFQIEQPGTHTYDVVVRQRPVAIARGHHYQLRFSTHASAPTKLRPRLSKVNVPYTELWAATVESGPAGRSYSATYDGAVDDEAVELAIEFGGPLAGQAPL